MKVYDERKSTAEEISRLLEKKSFDEVKLSPKVAAAVEKMFGRPLTAAEEVDIIVNDIRNKGDEALFEYTKKLDGADLSPATIRVTEEEFAEAEKAVDEKTMGAIRRAIANVRKFHEEQLPKTWLTPRAYGSFLGQKIDSGGQRGDLRPRRHRSLSFQRDHERGAGQSGRGAPDRYGSSRRPGWEDEPLCAGYGQRDRHHGNL